MKLSQLGKLAPQRLDRGVVERLSATEERRRRQQPGESSEGKPEPWSVRSSYRAPLGSTSQTPSGRVGVECSIGRVWAEARSITVSSGTEPVTVTLIASQNGVRALVECASGQTITGGSVRFWVFDDVSEQWSLGGVDETLPTGAQRVATTDQFAPVGGR